MIKVQVGSETHYGTHVNSHVRDVEFEGEEVGSWYEKDDRGNTGTDQTLYKAADGRLIVHEHSWTRWQGGTSTWELLEVSENDLRPNGRFEWLGQACGYGRPMTLDEALAG